MNKFPFLDLTAPYSELKKELDEGYFRVMNSGSYILGQEVAAFETEFAKYCGVEFCVGVGNGLDALHLILRGYEIGAGDEVIVPANTYIATWLAVTCSGATPVPVEPRLATCNLDPDLIEAAITNRTRAVMAVHLYGQPAEMELLRQICVRRGVRLIEDAAQAHGARDNGRRAGSLGDAAGWSFYPTKNLGALGDSGAVTTNDQALAEKVRKLRNYGFAKKNVSELQGVNSRLDELQAALLRTKLRYLDEWNSRRQKIAATYLSGLAGGGVTLPQVSDSSEPAWHLFVIRTARRDDLRRHLAASGIETMVHYPIPPHLQIAFAGMKLGRGAFPITERIHDEVLSLPIGPHLAVEDAARIVHAVQAFA